MATAKTLISNFLPAKNSLTIMHLGATPIKGNRPLYFRHWLLPAGYLGATRLLGQCALQPNRAQKCLFVRQVRGTN
ncbi:MAG: hypothetical protein EAY75_08665 [Bacteroidetes bacterium]|nr:MAG: hypothetical protein EAY75_08665 [Bacteroidota bacterium]